MSLTAAAATGFVVFLLSVQVIHSKNGWGVTFTSNNICALQGSTVQLHCTFTYPSRKNYRDTVVEKTFWFRGSEPVDLSTDPEYAGRVQNRCYLNSCTLTITDLRESDSAEYKFRFITNHEGGMYSGSPGITLSVTALQVKETSPYSWTELSCHSGCRLPGYPSYVWYKNGQKTSYYPDNPNAGDSYVCALSGHEDFHSPPLCVGGRSCNTVTYTDRSICAPKGSSVDISCTYSSSGSITSKLWFRSERSRQWSYWPRPQDLSKDPQYAGRVRVLEPEGGRSTVRISELTERDSAQYHFTFTAGSFEWRSSLPGTTLTVTALQVQVTTATVHQLYTEAELKCLSSCSPAARLSFVWFKNGQKIMTEETSTYKYNSSSGDDVSCAFRGHEDYRSPPVYAPKLPSVSVNSSEILEGSSVNLTCSSDANPAANYTWYKNGAPLSEEPQLILTSVQSSHSGEYYCTAENALGRRTSERISVDLRYPPRLPSVSVSPSAEIEEGSSVTLTCSSDANPAANYTWYKGSRRRPGGSAGIRLVHHFPSIRSEDSGIYYCTAENQYGLTNSTSVLMDVQYPPRLPSVSVSPSAEIVEGSSVNLTCSSDANPAANYTWYKEDQDSPAASGQNFTITDFRSDHSGNYYCEARNKRGFKNSTIHLTSVSASMTSVAAGSIAAVFLALIFLLVFLLIRRKTSSKQTSRESLERPGSKAQLDRRSERDQNKPADDQDDLCYATVQFCKKQEDPLYSNVCVAQPNTHRGGEEEEEEEGVEYSVVTFSTSTSKCEDAAEDPSALYSTVTKR